MHCLSKLSFSEMRVVPKRPETFALTRLLCRDASTSNTCRTGDFVGARHRQDWPANFLIGDRFVSIKKRRDERPARSSMARRRGRETPTPVPHSRPGPLRAPKEWRRAPLNQWLPRPARSARGRGAAPGTRGQSSASPARRRVRGNSRNRRLTERRVTASDHNVDRRRRGLPGGPWKRVVRSAKARRRAGEPARRAGEARSPRPSRKFQRISQ